MYKNQYIFFVLSLFLLISCSVPHSTQTLDKKSQFRVASYNIRYPSMDDEKTGNGWNKRKGPLANIVRASHFDIFGTQEGVDSQLTDLKKLLPDFDYVAAPYNISYCATFYKKSIFEVLDKGMFWFSPTPNIPSIGWDADDQRICQWTKFKVKATGKEFYFFNLHFYWRLEIAKRESGPLLVRKIKEIAGLSPVICTGDFNSESETSQIQAVKTLLADSYDKRNIQKDSVEKTTFPGGVFQGNPKWRADYIFTSHDFKVNDYRAIPDTYDGDRHPSDHLPVTSLLTF